MAGRSSDDFICIGDYVLLAIRSADSSSQVADDTTCFLSLAQQSPTIQWKLKSGAAEPCSTHTTDQLVGGRSPEDSASSSHFAPELCCFEIVHERRKNGDQLILDQTPVRLRHVHSGAYLCPGSAASASSDGTPLQFSKDRSVFETSKSLFKFRLADTVSDAKASDDASLVKGTVNLSLVNDTSNLPVTAAGNEIGVLCKFGFKELDSPPTVFNVWKFAAHDNNRNTGSYLTNNSLVRIRLGTSAGAGAYLSGYFGSYDPSKPVCEQVCLPHPRHLLSTCTLRVAPKSAKPSVLQTFIVEEVLEDDTGSITRTVGHDPLINSLVVLRHLASGKLLQYDSEMVKSANTSTHGLQDSERTIDLETQSSRDPIRGIKLSSTALSREHCFMIDHDGGFITLGQTNISLVSGLGVVIDGNASKDESGVISSVVMEGVPGNEMSDHRANAFANNLRKPLIDLIDGLTGDICLENPKASSINDQFRVEINESQSSLRRLIGQFHPDFTLESASDADLSFDPLRKDLYKLYPRDPHFESLCMHTKILDAAVCLALLLGELQSLKLQPDDRDHPAAVEIDEQQIDDDTDVSNLPNITTVARLAHVLVQMIVGRNPEASKYLLYRHPTSGELEKEQRGQFLVIATRQFPLKIGSAATVRAWLKGETINQLSTEFLIKNFVPFTDFNKSDMSSVRMVLNKLGILCSICEMRWEGFNVKRHQRAIVHSLLATFRDSNVFITPVDDDDDGFIYGLSKSTPLPTLATPLTHV
eukprot:SAG11_NODE_2609_length_3173_cov_7.596942_2_plen_758_part_00